MDVDVLLSMIRMEIASRPDDELATMVESLDSWISSGGYIPADWARAIHRG